jgi:hypothetical protein
MPRDPASGRTSSAGATLLVSHSLECPRQHGVDQGGGNEVGGANSNAKG